MSLQRVCVGECGQGGVSRRVCPSDGVWSNACRLDEGRRNSTERVATSAVEKVRECARQRRGAGQSLRCGKVRLGLNSVIRRCPLNVRITGKRTWLGDL